MLDSITSLLATCANCNQNQLSAEISADQPVVAVCHAGQRSTSPASPLTQLSTSCVSPPEATPESLRLRSRTIATSVAANQSQPTFLSRATLSPSSASPESVVSVSWSNTTSRSARSASNTATASTATTSNTTPNTAANASPHAASNSATSNSAASNSAASNHETRRLLQLGSREKTVTQLQTQLQQLGFYGGAIDGIYGTQTKTAVTQFQRSKRLQADGVVGINTWAALQTASRQPQAAKPSAPTPTPPTPADRPNAPTLPSPSAVPAPVAALPSAPQTQPPDKTKDSLQLPLNYLWILGWGIIYGSGWVLILKDTVKELKGFHFFAIANKKTSQPVNQQATKQSQRVSKATPKGGTHYSGNVPPSKAASQQAAIDPQSVQSVTVAANAPAASPTSNDANHSATGHTNSHTNSHTNDYPSRDPNSASSNHVKVEPFALDDPWQEENVEALPVQILQVILADAGQIQPIQNVFVVAPRPTHTRSRVKKPTSIYNLRATQQRIKTG